MDQNQILEIIKKEKPFLREQFGLIRIGVFGSYAKGKQHP